MKSSWRKKMDLFKKMVAWGVRVKKYKWMRDVELLKACVRRGSKDPKYAWMKAFSPWEVRRMTGHGCPWESPTKRDMEKVKEYPLTEEEEKMIEAHMEESDRADKERLKEEYREKRDW